MATSNVDLIINIIITFKTAHCLQSSDRLHCSRFATAFLMHFSEETEEKSNDEKTALKMIMQLERNFLIGNSWGGNWANEKRWRNAWTFAAWKLSSSGDDNWCCNVTTTKLCQRSFNRLQKEDNYADLISPSYKHHVFAYWTRLLSFQQSFNNKNVTQSILKLYWLEQKPFVIIARLSLIWWKTFANKVSLNPGANLANKTNFLMKFSWQKVFSHPKIFKRGRNFTHINHGFYQWTIL